MKKFLSAVLVLFLAASFQLSAQSANWFEGKFPKELVRANGKKAAAVAVLKNKMVAVYFSASWCPPCRAFSPQLVKFYKAVQEKKGKNALELVFVSFDRNSSAMMDYMKKAKMPWLAMPFGSPEAKALANALQVRGIPALVVYDKTGKLITKSARSDVSQLGAAAFDTWNSAKK